MTLLGVILLVLCLLFLMVIILRQEKREAQRTEQPKGKDDAK